MYVIYLELELIFNMESLREVYNTVTVLYFCSGNIGYHYLQFYTYFMEFSSIMKYSCK